MDQNENGGPRLAEGVPPGLVAPLTVQAPVPVAGWSNAELVACVTGRRSPGLLPPWESDFLGMATCSEGMLARTLALRPAQARRLAAALEIARRLTSGWDPERPLCRKPEDVVAIMRPLVLIDHERLWCLPIDPRERLLCPPIEVARGDVDGTDASPRAVCRAALRARAASMIVVHNHPSGDPTPSCADANVTSRLIAAGRTVDVPLADHIVVCANGRFTSMRITMPGCWK